MQLAPLGILLQFLPWTGSREDLPQGAPSGGSRLVPAGGSRDRCAEDSVLGRTSSRVVPCTLCSRSPLSVSSQEQRPGRACVFCTASSLLCDLAGSLCRAPYRAMLRRPGTVSPSYLVPAAPWHLLMGPSDSRPQAQERNQVTVRAMGLWWQFRIQI